MKKHLEIYRIEHHTDAWYEFRRRGIGGSEAGTVLNLNRYDTAARLYHEKIGAIEPRKDDNMFMFMGRYMEDQIANLWKYWDGTDDGLIKNFTNSQIVRECRNINGYVVNSNYPWLFASIDRLINKKGGVNMITGEALKEEAVLEIKNQSYWAGKAWEDGIPIYHLIQVHVYMIILETDYAEIALLNDGIRLTVEKIQRDEELVKRILSITQNWWNDRVVPAKQARELRDQADAAGNIGQSEKYEGIIQRLEPDPDYSEAYKDFMSESFVKEREIVDGTMELYSLAKTYEVMKKIKGEADKVMNLIKNTFIKHLKNYGAESVSFDSLGSVNWTERKGSASRTFRSSIKEKPHEDIVKEEFAKINQNCY